MCFFAYESEKREAEAFAMSTAALVLGGLAIVGGGAAILSRTGAGKLGEKVVSGFEAAGGKIADIFNYNNVTDKGTLIMTPALKIAMNNAIGQLKAESIYSYTDDYNQSSSNATGYNFAMLTSQIYASTGDLLRVSFDYSSNVVKGSGSVHLGTSSSSNIGSSLFNLYQSPSGTYSGTVEITKTMQNQKISLYASTKNTSETVTISNFKIENVTKAASPDAKQYQQYKNITSDSDARLTQIDNALNKTSYQVSANSVQENVSTIEQLESTLAAVEDNTAGTNTLIDRMITALGNIPSAIKAEMSNLWADAGAIWSGMNDTLINIKTDVSAKIGAMSDTMAGGIDNIRTDIGAMMENLRSGIDTVGTNVAGWGQLTLDGIDAGIGTITSGLTNIWTKTTTAIETAATATTTAINTGIGTITDGLTTITDWVIGFPAMFFSWFVPPDFSFLGPLITKATNDLEDKFGTLPSLADLGSAITIQEKSIYDIEITLMGKNYKIVPIALKPTIDWARPFLTAAVNLTSITFLIHRNKRELFK